MTRSISPEDLVKLAEVKPEPIETPYEVDDWEVGQPRKVKWLIRDFIPTGRVTLLCGRGGIGKGLVVMRLVAELTQGRDPINGINIQPLRVHWLTCEEDFEEDLLPLGLASGVDQKRIKSLRIKPGEDMVINPEALEALVKEFGADLIVIDHLFGFVPAEVKTSDPNGGAALMRPFVELAQRTGIAVLVLCHPRKGEGAAWELLLGSTMIRNMARLVLVLGEVDDELVLAVEKSNRGAKRAHAFKKVVEGDQAWAEASGPSDLTADDVMKADRAGRTSDTEDKREARISEFLRENPRSTARQIRAGARLNTEAVSASLKDLEEEGIIAKEKRSGKGGGFLYSLATDTGEAQTEDGTPSNEVQLTLTSNES